MENKAKPPTLNDTWILAGRLIKRALKRIKSVRQTHLQHFLLETIRHIYTTCE